MSAAWPTGFPPPKRGDYAVQIADLAASSDFALGSRSRPLFADGPDLISASVVLSLAQWQYLQGWVRYTLAQGTRWFQMPLLAAGAISTIEVRLAERKLQLTPQGPKYVRVKLSLETRQGTAPSAEYFAALAAFPDPETVSPSLQALEDFVNG